ncbi:hypothetical protein SAMN04487764_1351 [Gillisia sp. Hel1_33_143]|uniref:DUF5723 family protein n=1 Tax=Gillisia sp. Hel1_33_143 TaxID=1336796 RepID=UPI000879D3D8|nr:DUF5723 family protein [Gillisia sp. Hel1_33_143]SDS05666.1 hypothetical protein SAMN04487764_1351 [Gillisia sp. Hel1_33_143]
MRIVISIILFLCFSVLTAQNKQLLYNVSALPQTLMSNPGANINFDGHIGIPFLSQISFAVGSSGVDMHDIFKTSSNGINSRITNTIQRLTNQDYFMVNEQIEILSLGWRINKDNYLSAGVYQETDLFAYFPKDPMVLINEGNNDYLNVPFKFEDVSFTGEVLTVYHLGWNKRMDNKLTLGARLKLYSGIFNVESTDNSGTFTTRETPEGLNYYRHFASGIDIRVNTSGYASLKDDSKTVQEASKEILKRSFFGGNVGAGIDLGATYKIDQNFVVTGAIQDFGLMYQREDVENYLYYGTYETSGIEPLFPEVAPGGKAIPYWDIFEDEVDANLKDETIQESYITWRPLKINTSLQYGFGETVGPCNYLRPLKRRFENIFGIQLFGVKRPRGLKYAFTMFYDRKFTPDLRMKITYTLDDFSYANVGLMVSKKINNFNLYLAADNLFGYINLARSQHQALQMGLQFIFIK